MKIINGYAHAKKIYNNGLTKIIYRDVLYLAAYLRKELKFGDVRVEKKIIEYCEAVDEDFSAVNSSDFIHSVIRNSKNMNLKDTEFVEIYKHELDKIQEIKDFSVQVFVFSALVYNKIFYSMSKKYNVDIHTINDILDMTGLKISKDRFIRDYYFMIKAANLSYHRAGRNYIKLNIERFTGESVGKITVFRNLKDIYKDMIGGEFYYCKRCGDRIKFEKGKRRKVYCDICFKIERKNSLRKFRNKVKQENTKNVFK